MDRERKKEQTAIIVINNTGKVDKKNNYYLFKQKRVYRRVYKKLL